MNNIFQPSSSMSLTISSYTFLFFHFFHINEIEHCIDCYLENEICIRCENRYFPLFAGLICLRCNDQVYGQIGCEGNCDASKYAKITNIICDNCKEGYYNIEGICIQC